jgi:hypothetical protein
MRCVLRLAACAALIALLLLGGSALPSSVFGALGLDWRDLANSLRQYDAASRREKDLAVRSQVALEQMRVKDAIAGELIAGRRSLAEASRQFGELSGTTEYVGRYIHDRFPGVTAEEGMSRYVIEWACTTLPKQPEREALQRRLEAELDEHLALAR